MSITPRAIFFTLAGALVFWFIYSERAILTPFVVAGIFAYLFNPVVTFITTKLRIPRTLSIVLIYSLLTLVIVLGGTLLFSRILEESTDLSAFFAKSIQNMQLQIRYFPTWLQPTARDTLTTLKHSRLFAFTSGESLFPFFSQAISRIAGLFIFLFSTFYFLKDGDKFFQNVLAITPAKYKIDIEILFRKLNVILSSYLRGQIFLVFLMATVTYISLLILGVRFAFLLGLFSGFAEIVPVVGPIVAASVAILVAFFTGSANFGLSSIQVAVAIAAVYFVLRQLEDYFIMPYVFGKITKLPAFVIFFAVVAGGHIGGLLGLILAVPFAAMIRLSLQFFFEQFDKNGSRK